MTGSVVDGADRPLADAGIEVQAALGVLDWTTILSGRSRQDGSYRVGPLPVLPAAVRIRVSRAGCATEFEYHLQYFEEYETASLNFKSTSYDWLVVAGARAQYKGKGTINGEGDDGFMITAIDGQVSGGGDVDRFRIKIWDIDTGVVVYDNQAGADDGANVNDFDYVRGGSSVIHKE